jgi:hypothetical protein
MPVIERETKLAVSPEDHGRILNMDPAAECTDQLNVYLYDPAKLAERRGHFRVRFETGRRPVVTLKIPAGWRGDIREMVEVEAPLAQMGPQLRPWPRRWVDPAANLPDEFLRHFRELGVSRLRRLGWMRNRRCRMTIGGLGQIEVDRTSLPGGAVLHEVEIEEPDLACHQAIVEEVRRVAPSAEVSRIGKFSRFLDTVGLVPSGD